MAQIMPKAPKARVMPKAPKAKWLESPDNGRRVGGQALRTNAKSKVRRTVFDKRTPATMRAMSTEEYVASLVDRAASVPRWPLTAPACSGTSGGAVRLGSDCTGYSSEFLALKYSGVDVKTVFCAEIDPDKVVLLRRAHDMFGDTGFTFYRDIKERNNQDAPECDIFMTGAPCQAYSTAGRGAGLDDGKDRGVTIFYSLDYVRHKRPRLVIVENVRGLTFQRHAHVLTDILSILTNLGYKAKWRVLNTKDHGIPQSRPRLYIVAIRKDSCVGNFKWPTSVQSPGILRFLDAADTRSKSSLNQLSKTALDNVVYWRTAKQKSDNVRHSPEAVRLGRQRWQ
jgi:DNA-cytosine methyltransferase